MTERLDIETTRALARKIRRHVVEMTHRAKASHVGTSLSMAELLAVLYGGVLRVDPSALASPDRDRFVLSKGHGCAGLYAVLAERGFFPPARLGEFYQDGTRMAGHVTHGGIPGVEVSTGALGHGLSIACGMALAGRRDRRPFRVFALLSDGECDEGATWEAALLAARSSARHPRGDRRLQQDPEPRDGQGGARSGASRPEVEGLRLGSSGDRWP